jgi:hypothetical protein
MSTYPRLDRYSPIDHCDHLKQTREVREAEMCLILTPSLRHTVLSLSLVHSIMHVRLHWTMTMAMAIRYTSDAIEIKLNVMSFGGPRVGGTVVMITMINGNEQFE